MEKNQKMMNNMGNDKYKHVAVSFFLTILLYMFSTTLKGVGLPEVLLVVIGIGIGKEVIDDKFHKGTPDYKDIVANYIGILLGYALIAISLSL